MSRPALIAYRRRADFTNDQLNALFAAAWPDHQARDFLAQRPHWLTDVAALDGELLIGFAYLAWDGGAHAFLLDPTVHPDYQRRGIGQQLIAELIGEARRREVEWVHVDFEPRLREFYAKCGFRPTEAGLKNLRSAHC